MFKYYLIGKLLKNKTTIFIGKKTFNTNFVELNNQLNSIENDYKEKFKINDPVLESKKQDDVELENFKIHENEVYTKWTEKDVDDWLLEKKIHPCILDALRPSNGKILYEIFLMKTKASSFFYESLLTKNPTLALRDYAVFSNEINTLFKNK